MKYPNIFKHISALFASLCLLGIPCFCSAQDSDAAPAPAAPAAAAPAEALDFSKLPEPMAFAKAQYAEALKLNAMAPSATRDSQIKSLVNALANYDDYAQRAMTSKWDSADDAKKAEFKSLFKELAELSYLKKISDKSFKDNYNIDWDRVIKTKTSATVSCFTKQKDVETELELILHAAGNTWQVYDVLIDGASLAKTYQKKYAKKLDEKGIDGIIADMKAEIANLKK